MSELNIERFPPTKAGIAAAIAATHPDEWWEERVEWHLELSEEERMIRVALYALVQTAYCEPELFDIETLHILDDVLEKNGLPRIISRPIILDAIT